MQEFRCQICGRLLAKVKGENEVEIKCPKCKTMNLYENGVVAVYGIQENRVTAKVFDRRGPHLYNCRQNISKGGENYGN